MLLVRLCSINIKKQGRALEDVENGRVGTGGEGRGRLGQQR